MTSLRLETFVPLSGDAAGADAARRLADGREAAYDRGFLAGQAAATAAFLDDEARLTSALVEGLADSRLTNEAARRHVAATLGPALAAIAAAVAPALASAGFAAEIVRLVERATAQAPDARPRLRCAPEVEPTLRVALGARRLAVTIEPAPELLPREAQLFWDQGYDHLDLDACIAQIGACIASHLGRNSEGKGDDPDSAS